MPKHRPWLTAELRGEAIASYVRCRALRSHMWDPIQATNERSDLGGIMLLLRCESCGTIRHDVFSPVTGDLMARWYDYPEHYRDAERHDIGWWRTQWIETDERVAGLTVRQAPTRATTKAVSKTGRLRSVG